MGRCAGYFPLVGLIIGFFLAGLSCILRFVLPPGIANALLLVALVILTGALHLDGFADTCDGLAGHKTVEDRWRIMRDSQIGAFGVISITLMLLAKYVSLNGIPGTLMTVSLVLMPVASRWAMVYAVFAYPYARPSGLGKAFKEGTRWPGFVVATIFTITIAVVTMQFIGMAILAISWLIVVVLAAYFNKSFTGLTGDSYGAINEITEVSVLILVNVSVFLRLL
jgi:adenosylcobinamide-GDP ribazoletransferase